MVAEKPVSEYSPEFVEIMVNELIQLFNAQKAVDAQEYSIKNSIYAKKTRKSLALAGRENQDRYDVSEPRIIASIRRYRVR